MKENHPLFSLLPPPWDRIFPHIATALVWGVLFALIWLLRSFFLLLFLSFVFSIIQANGVARLEKYLRSRPLRVTVVAILFLTILSMAGVFLIPKVKEQTTLFLNQFTSYLDRVDEELLKLNDKYPLLARVLPELLSAEPVQETPATPNEEKKELRHSPSRAMLGKLLMVSDETGGSQNINHLLGTLGNVGGKIATATSTFLLSLLFSFLIVLDLPQLAASVRELENTRLRFIYLSVADNIREFATVLGKALEAQLLVAIINSILTAIGIALLGIGQHVAFLSVIVFFCSFIPVIGVFISSIPICLIALQSSGVTTMFLAILLITIIHLIEGYILNPKIYGSYMRINPVIVLIILTVGGKLFGFWGLLLGVPICTFVFGHAIRIREQGYSQRPDEERQGAGGE
jgi:predicted PurR-regulated permease PerM